MPVLRLAEEVPLFGRYIRFSLHLNEDESGMMSSKVPDKEKFKTDASQVLMNGSKRLTLPSPQNEENNKRIVYNQNFADIGESWTSIYSRKLLSLVRTFLMQ